MNEESERDAGRLMNGPRRVVVSGRLLEVSERGAEVQVQRLAVYHESGDGFHAGGGGFGDAVPGGAEVNDFDVNLGRIEVAGDDAFGFEANGAASVVEFSGGFHGRTFFEF